MPSIKIENEQVKAPVEKVFGFLSDMNNYEELVPDTVYDWQSTKESCSFKVKGMGGIGMKISNTVAPEKITVVSADPSPVSFELTLDIKADGNHSTCGMVLEADVNPFIWMMAEKPLRGFFSHMAKAVSAKLNEEA